MSLCKIYNMCPKGSHIHGKDTPEKKELKIKNGFNKLNCVICNPKKNPFPYSCDKYNYINRFFLTREAKITLLICMSRRNSPLWLPTELHRFIIQYFKKPVYPLSIFNEHTKKHFESCSDCGAKLIDFIDKHSCSNHVVIRK